MGKIYNVGLRGESNYQPAIRQTDPRSPVRLRLEPKNPHDGKAIAVENSRGQTIGYIPADSFVKNIVHDQAKPVACHIESIGKASNGKLGVVIIVEINPERPTLIYTSQAQPDEKPKPKSVKPAPRKPDILKLLFKLFR